METLGPNLYLIGFMGVGKSAVGRQAARVLHHEFIDSDQAIEQREGRSIRDIFAAQGEAHFRELEAAFLRDGHPARGCVVACGGGLPIPPGRREMLLERGVVVCLFASVETILRRVSGNQKRPLLNTADPAARVRELLAAREPIYMQTGIGVSAEGRGMDEIVGNVVRIYRREALAWKESTDA
ncbi:MAG: shikimate kinase [Opitutales bacterium]